MYGPVLEGRGDFTEWRDAARAALAANIPPEKIDWRLQDDGFGLLDFPGAPLPTEGGAPVSVPAAFVALAQAVICHSDPGRFALLYRLLWRLKRDRALLQFKSDPDVSDVRLLEKSVRRDYHKMTAFVRFKELPLPQGQGGRRRFVAWFEPDHFIIERTASFFQRRFTDMDWLIVSPKGSARWDGNLLQTSREAAAKPDLKDETDDLWRTYYANIFNPARLKIKAMTAEMPKKYWKNLPEAELIPDLILGAEARVLEMAAREASRSRFTIASRQRLPHGKSSDLCRVGRLLRWRMKRATAHGVPCIARRRRPFLATGRKTRRSWSSASSRAIMRIWPENLLLAPPASCSTGRSARSVWTAAGFTLPMPLNTSNTKRAANGVSISARMRARWSNAAGGSTRKSRLFSRS